MSFQVKTITQGLKYLGKYLDQTALTNKLYNAMPVILTGSSLAYGAHDVYTSPKEQRKKRILQNMAVLGFTVATALIATRGLKINKKQIFEGIIELPENNTKGLAEILKMPLGEKSKELVEKVSDEKILTLKEVKYLMNDLQEKFNDSSLIKKVIPDSETEEPFADLLKLSWLGLIPVVGGITGGIVGDKITGENWQRNLPNKVKEGTYQYLNNIALCNVGAGIGALAMNAANVKSKTARFTAMLVGVVGAGLVAGNAIANFVGKTVVDPLFDKNQQKKDLKHIIKNLNSERHAETLDLCLHIDDIASVGFLSGFKWIGPILPMLYSVSGYRAGIGYRNGKEKNIFSIIETNFISILNDYQKDIFKPFIQ